MRALEKRRYLRGLTRAVIACLALAFSLPSFAASISPDCESRFRNPIPSSGTTHGSLAEAANGKLSAVLNRPVELKFRIDKYPDDEPPFVIYSVRASDGDRDVGSMSCRVLGEVLDVQMTIVGKAFQNAGVSGALMEAILKEYPSIRIIRTEAMTGLNDTFVSQALAKGKSIEDAIRESPAYRIRAKLGFGKIIPGTANRSSFGFSVERDVLPDVHEPAPGSVSDEIARAAERKLSFRPAIEWKDLKHMSKERVRALDPNGFEVGSFSYKLKGDRIHDVSIEVGSQYRNKRVSELLFAEVLKRHPEVRRIDTVLISDNAGVVYHALNAGVSCEEAIRRTPAYKMRARFGFTRLISPVCDFEKGYSFSVMKPL